MALLRVLVIATAERESQHFTGKPRPVLVLDFGMVAPFQHREDRV